MDSQGLAFEPVVTPEMFYTAQGIIKARSRRQSNDGLIQRLRSLYQQRGFLSTLIIDEAENMDDDAHAAFLPPTRAMG